MKKTATAVGKVSAGIVEHGGDVSLEGQSIELATGDEPTLLLLIDGTFAGGECKLRDFSISLCGAKAAASVGSVFKLPAEWEGTPKLTDGNYQDANYFSLP